MKRITFLAICFVLLLAFAGCDSHSSDVALTSGNYYIVGDYEEYMTPYLWLDLDESTFALGAGSVVSYAESGSFEIDDGRLIATSQSTTFIFEIKDSKNLILIDNGDNEFFQLPENAKFAFSEDIR